MDIDAKSHHADSVDMLTIYVSILGLMDIDAKRISIIIYDCFSNEFQSLV